MIIDLDDKIIEDSMSRIFYIRKQLKSLKQDNRKELLFLVERTINELEKILIEERLRFSKELEDSVERLI
jgi:hypothetical protein|tara:strand:+ start:88 stop:297 length:210 start_codon:yes stop_codon:yes gene_type:complete